MTNIVRSLQRVVMDNQGAVAIAGAEPMTFSTLWARTDAFAGGLQSVDCTAGDRIAIRLSQPRAILLSIFGSLRKGCVPVLIPPTYSDDETVAVLNQTGARAYVTDDSLFLSILNRASETTLAVTVGCDAALGIDFEDFLDNGGLNNTGGRTGTGVISQPDESCGLICYDGHVDDEPLGVAYTHAGLLAAIEAGQTIRESDQPLSHLSGLALSDPLELLYGALAALFDGGQYHAYESWDPAAVLSLLHTKAVNRVFVTPSQASTIPTESEAAAKPIAVIESLLSGLESDPTAYVHLRGCPETGLTHLQTPLEAGPHGLGTPIEGVRTRPIVFDEQAELAISSDAVMDYYVGRPELTASLLHTREKTRWVRTGIGVGDDEVTGSSGVSPLSTVTK